MKVSWRDAMAVLYCAGDAQSKYLLQIRNRVFTIDSIAARFHPMCAAVI